MAAAGRADTRMACPVDGGDQPSTAGPTAAPPSSTGTNTVYSLYVVRCTPCRGAVLRGGMVGANPILLRPQLCDGFQAHFLSGASLLCQPRPSTSRYAASDPIKNYSTALASFFFSLLGATPYSGLTVGRERVQLPTVCQPPPASPVDRDLGSARLTAFG